MLTGKFNPPGNNTPKAASKRSSLVTAPKIGYEIVDPNAEPPQEEVDEYAKRIGIDVEKEPHLLHLAREGLKQRLPEKWKPCFEPLRNVWYYYNTETLSSQWEHPLDEVYRERVRVARTEVGMDRIRNFDPKKSRPPLKSLPPLKKGFGGTSTILREKPEPIPQFIHPLPMPPHSPITPIGFQQERGDLLPDKNIIVKKNNEEIEMLKGNYKSLVDSLESQFKAEEQNVRQKHDKILKDMRANLTNEKKKFIDSLKAQKELEIAELQELYDKKKSSVKAEMDKLTENDTLEKLKEEVENVKHENKLAIDSLILQFKNEENALKQEHVKSLDELRSSFALETEKLIQALKAQRDEEIERIEKDYALLKQTLNRQSTETQEQNAPATVTKTSSFQQTEPILIPSPKIEPLPSEIKKSESEDSVLFTKNPILEAKEIELNSIKTKYKQLQEKYEGLKSELKVVATLGHKKLEEGMKGKQILNDSLHSESRTTTSEDEGCDSKTGESEENNSMNIPVEHSNSTIQIDDMIVGSNLGLNKALSALEVLRNQILTMNGCDEKQPNLIKPIKSKSDENDSRPKKHSKRQAERASSNDVISTIVNTALTNEPSHHQIVAEAKDFIKAQKQRLMDKSSGNKFDMNRNPYFPSKVSDVQEASKRIAELTKNLGNYHNLIGRNSNNKDSEAESSGFGSLFSLKRADTQSPESKSQVAKDIDGILVSLKKLDDQMKSLWSMVGQEKEPQGTEALQNLFKPLVHKISPSAMAHLNYMSSSGNAETFNRYNTRNFINPSSINTRYNVAESSSGNNFFGNYTGSSTNGVGWMDHNQPMMYNNSTSNLVSTSGSDLPESLLNKTKDLREWLDKF